jgi:hypothetical protein
MVMEYSRRSLSIKWKSTRLSIFVNPNLETLDNQTEYERTPKVDLDFHRIEVPTYATLSR